MEDQKRATESANQPAPRENRPVYVAGDATVVIRGEHGDTNQKQTYARAPSGNGEQNPWQLKLSDALIAYFTYCLVIVGWGAMRSSESSVQRQERAYLFVGGADNITPDFKNGLLEKMMTCTNNGRSFAVITHYYFGWSDKEPCGDPNYKNEGIYYRKMTDLVLYAGGTVELNKTKVEVAKYPFMFGYLEYKDIYNKYHTSRFSMRWDIKDGQTYMAGPLAWNEWD